ncbi:MAG: vitamin K epoxide reductase family protein [Mycobacteriales bacterium]
MGSAARPVPGSSRRALPPAARWVRVSSLVLSLLGLAVSAYLTIEHYSAGNTLACPATATINCAKVTTSAYSTLFGIPVAVLGLAFFVAMSLMCVPQAWRSGSAVATRGRLAAVGIGVLFVVYLVWAELFRIDAICLWCTFVHVVTLALFAVIALGAALRPADDG